MIVLLIKIQIQTMRRSRLAQLTSAFPRGRLMKASTAPATMSFHFVYAEAAPNIQDAATSLAPNRTLMNRHARGRLRRRSHGAGADERADKAPLSAILPYAPNTTGANNSQTPNAALSGRFHGAVTQNIGRNICAASAG